MAKIRAATSKPTTQKRKRAPRRRLLVQTFYLTGGVEVTIKFPEGAARWQSTQSTVSIATGAEAFSVIPQAYQTAAVASGVGVPGSQGSWSNCDDRGLAAVAGTADPKAVLKGETDPISGFLDRVEKNVIADELGSDPNAELTGEETEEQLQQEFADV